LKKNIASRVNLNSDFKEKISQMSCQMLENEELSESNLVKLEKIKITI